MSSRSTPPNRSWPGGAGYGNGWNESVSREFTFNGTGPVTFAYGYNFSSELNYDYTRVYLVANGASTLLRTHHGTGSGTASISLASYLAGVSSYSILFRFTSDSGWSDEDGSYDSSCGGAFTFDNVTLTGGGENYSTDFETYEDGWHVDMSEPSEYVMVENRRALGFDAFIHGSGLVISHCDDYVMNGIGNTGGSTGAMPHGVAIMEADGLGQLASNTNRGDGGDCYPGTSSNTLFDNASTPNSLSYNGNATNVSVSSISASGDPMTATMSGGWFPPTLASMTPASGYTDGGAITVGEAWAPIPALSKIFTITHVQNTGVAFGRLPGLGWLFMVVNLAVGLYTPPVGTTLFITSALARVKVGETVRAMGPFYLVAFLVLAIVSYVPASILR